jgi:hypothetical protein
MRKGRTMHETKGGKRTELAVARRNFAPDDAHVIVLALIAVTLPSPVIFYSQFAYGLSPAGLLAGGTRPSGMLRVVLRRVVAPQHPSRT